jgi:hypothetical protein
MAPSKTLTDVKRKLSDKLLDTPGVSGVGLRGDRVVVYLESKDAKSRRSAERIAQAVAPTTSVIFEVTGRFGKQ